MSFSWIGNSWGGPQNDLDFFPAAAAMTRPSATTSIVSNFPARPLVSQSIPQTQVGNYDYQIPTYLILKDMTANKTPLALMRGGYSGLPPTVETINKCQLGSVSTNFYCNAQQPQPSVQLLGVYGPQ